MFVYAHDYTCTLLQLYCAFSTCNCSFTQRLFLRALHRLFLSLLCAHWAPFGVECAGAKVEISRVCCCSASHADTHHFTNHDDTYRVVGNKLQPCVRAIPATRARRVCVSVCVVYSGCACVSVYVCVYLCVWLCVRACVRVCVPVLCVYVWPYVQ